MGEIIEVQHILQQEEWDCGLACARMIFRYCNISLGEGDTELTRVCKDLEIQKAVWTIDLAHLMSKFNIKHDFYTITFGVDPKYSTVSLDLITILHVTRHILHSLGGIKNYLNFTTVIRLNFLEKSSGLIICFRKQRTKVSLHIRTATISSIGVLPQRQGGGGKRIYRPFYSCLWLQSGEGANFLQKPSKAC
ncbi:uncharacterized protein LOC592643 isoform X3 [Strongylocentrotus purpuratus]|uniref:Uncharacterized protein n=1 Tax=Strongylocentrotus purpuratus TaxID=7668 RepID=A0A7M7PAC2_STRPU|nr:uncharacterized protein LOC592643 isoform X3 [Strongylocentrotus purpuratus]